MRLLTATILSAAVYWLIVKANGYALLGFVSYMTISALKGH